MNQEKENQLLALVAFLVLPVDQALGLLEHHVEDEVLDAAFEEVLG
jgi:hypothetical protein